jgi:hypothetical protein
MRFAGDEGGADGFLPIELIPKRQIDVAGLAIGICFVEGFAAL